MKNNEVILAEYKSILLRDYFGQTEYYETSQVRQTITLATTCTNTWLAYNV